MKEKERRQLEVHIHFSPESRSQGRKARRMDINGVGFTRMDSTGLSLHRADPWLI